MSLDVWLIRNQEAMYLLKVTGDFRCEAGIVPGDVVVVERRATAKEGDIVIAQVDGGWTMKHFRRHAIPAPSTCSGAGRPKGAHGKHNRHA